MTIVLRTSAFKRQVGRFCEELHKPGVEQNGAEVAQGTQRKGVDFWVKGKAVITGKFLM